MLKAKLGKTGLCVNKDGFGALPVQRRSVEDGVALVRAAYEAGLDFFDTARVYSDSEEKVGKALFDVRDKVVLATKTQATTPEVFWEDLKTSLRLLQTDYVDIYQFHNAARCYAPGDGTGMYEAMQEAKEKGMIRHISITTHKLGIAKEIIESGLYATLQYPFSYLSTEEECEMVRGCEEKGIGFISMKGLSGGLITDIEAARAFQAQFPGAVPIWGLQKLEELEELLAVMDTPGEMTEAVKARIAKDKAELQGNFCRGCGYCLPCPVDIRVSWCARMQLFLERSPWQGYVTDEWQKEMGKIEDCLQCGQCASRCPYDLDTPQLLVKNLAYYKEFLIQKGI